eukprot:Sspe_Gene.98132::Locus_71596_Transcript_1_1_Confidence_1.000_Length_1846::g.98132::m.98132
MSGASRAMLAGVLLLAAVVHGRPAFPQSYHIALLREGHTCTVVDKGWGQVHRLALSSVYVTEAPEWHECDLNGGGESKAKFMNFYGPKEHEVIAKVNEVCTAGVNATLPRSLPKKDNVEVRKLVGSGDSSNRIDVVFMGDGYTLDERGKFFRDMERLTQDMFTDRTFRSYLPVFNIWAIHVPSVESGIGTHSTPRNTAFGLYRVGTELRGVYTSKPADARAACRLADGCDFPSLIANDDYYGGLGGEFVIGTRSETTGTVVLRHEMGHNFVNVGEEYDDGSVYRGVNNDNTLTNIKWAHWLSDPKETIPEQRAVQRIGAYPWHDLAKGKQTFRFTSDGTYRRWYMRFTLSGCDVPGAVKVTLDGNVLNWQPTQPPTLDRQFYVFSDMTNGFRAGEHELVFEQGEPPAPGKPARQLCSLSLNEYGSEEEFRWENDFVGAYPTWDVRGRKSYRPQNEMCLMRNMSSSDFCVACREGMWWQFFMRMSAIDRVEVHHELFRTHVKVVTVPLGQFRDPPVPGLNDRLDITWEHNGSPVPELTGYFSWDRTTASSRGRWTATVVYKTEEVRVDPNGLLTFQHTIDV